MADNGKDIRDTALPHELDIHFEKLDAVVAHITAAALERVRRIREKCDVVIASVTARGDATQAEVSSYRAICRDAVDTAKIMESALDELAAKLQVQLPPAKPADKPADKADKTALIDKALEDRRKQFPPRLETITGHFMPERPLNKAE